METTLRVRGLDCADEVHIIESVLKPLSGVQGVRFDLLAAKVIVQHRPELTPAALIQRINSTGFEAQQTQPGTTSFPRAIHPGRATSLAAAGLLTGAGLVLDWLGMTLGASMLFLGAILAGGYLIFPKAAAAARRFSPDMNVLMTLAVVGAAAIGQWSEAAVVIFLFSLAEFLEAWSIVRARCAVQSILDLSPKTARVKRGRVVEVLSLQDVALGDTLLIRSGDRIPLDGVVTSGLSTVNQAPITGESLPVDKKPCDPVFAGTINGEGALEVKVTKRAADTTLARIIQRIEEAQSRRAPLQRWVDRFARSYTPAVLLLAALTATVPVLIFNDSWHEWFYRSLVLLVIACPCALVIATPVSVVSGLTALARRGVMVKDGASLEGIGKLQALAIDKTGTLTEGRPRVLKIIPFPPVSESELLRLAAAINVHSSHPLAQAIILHARDRGIEFPRSRHYQARLGRGAEAEVDGHLFFVGNHRFFHESDLCSKSLERQLAELEAEGNSVSIVGHKPHRHCPGTVLGLIALADSVRPHSASAIRELHRAGIKEVMILSGDNQRTVDAIARQIGVDQARGDLLPDQKIDEVRRLVNRFKHAGMVGDGVNDAPALAAATVGIAMGAAGSDAAIETADIALMQDDLRKVAEAVCLGRRTLKIIQANIGFSLAVKAVFLILTLIGYASLWLAILADTGATLAVIANALRLLKKAPQLIDQPAGGLARDK